jgi:hypothetical protein
MTEHTSAEIPISFASVSLLPLFSKRNRWATNQRHTLLAVRGNVFSAADSVSYVDLKSVAPYQHQELERLAKRSIAGIDTGKPLPADHAQETQIPGTPSHRRVIMGTLWMISLGSVRSWWTRKESNLQPVD